MTIADTPPFSPARRLQALLDVEVALVEALADAGVVPSSSVGTVRTVARAESFDLTALDAEARQAGNIVIPLVRHLTQRVAASDPVAAGHVHLGATSQDLLDTALVLQLREAGASIVDTLARAGDAAAALAERHASTPMAGRTWLQQATPTTFGAKAVVWMQGLDRSRDRLTGALHAAGDLQFGGATGTLASLGEAGPAVAQAMGRRLGLRVPASAWHTERSRVADVACALGLVCGALGKIGRDLALLSQTEVGEVAEQPAPGRGGSSSMPHKQNPVASAHALAAAVRAPGLVATMLAGMPQEHERAIGGWQAEWDTLPALVELTVGASGAMVDALSHLRVDAARMRINLDAAGGVARAEGLVAALAPHMGRVEALRMVEEVCAGVVASGGTLHDVAARHAGVQAHLDPAALAAAVDPAAIAQPAVRMVQRVLADRRARKGSQHG